MLASPDTYQDVKKYYDGTIIVCPEVGENKALYLEYTSIEGMRVSDVDGNKGFIDYTDQPYQIHSPLVVRRQWYNSEYSGGAAMMQRIPARMWRKGICNENTAILGFNSVGTFGTKVAEIRLASIQDFLLNKENFTTEVSSITFEGRDSVALSAQWTLIKSKNMIYLYHAPVGTFSLPKKIVSLLKEFSQLPLPKALATWTVKYV